MRGRESPFANPHTHEGRGKGALALLARSSNVAPAPSRLGKTEERVRPLLFARVHARACQSYRPPGAGWKAIPLEVAAANSPVQVCVHRREVRLEIRPKDKRPHRFR